MMLKCCIRDLCIQIITFPSPQSRSSLQYPLFNLGSLVAYVFSDGFQFKCLDIQGSVSPEGQDNCFMQLQRLSFVYFYLNSCWRVNQLNHKYLNPLTCRTSLKNLPYNTLIKINKYALDVFLGHTVFLSHYHSIVTLTILWL